MVFLFIVPFMTADNFLIADLKRVEKSSKRGIGFKESFFFVKLTICRYIRKFCYLKVISISFSLFALN